MIRLTTVPEVNLKTIKLPASGGTLVSSKPIKLKTVDYQDMDSKTIEPKAIA